MMKLCLILVVWQTIVVTNAAQTKCSEGTYLQQFDDKSFCEECPRGTFMPWKNHTASTCFECTKIENSSVEILISPCDRYHDADIQCKDGYFRRLARNPHDKPSCLTCKPACDKGDFQVHRCENFTDLGCCPGENYDYEYYHGNSGPRKCRERPWMCERGEYLDTSVNECKPCPGNTFMSEDYHSYTNCWDCHYKSEVELPLHTVIAQNCTSTQPARYRCRDGYYMNHGMSYRGDDVGCSPCNSCGEGMYEVRQCDGYHDTVCCHKPNMTVTDMPLGGQCIDKIEELMLYPSVGSLQVRKGGCQSVICYIALTKKKAKPDLTWFGPNMDNDQQFQFEDENYQSGVTVYRNTLTMCNFSTADEGIYHCRDKLSKLNQGMQIHIGLACEYGTYNPPHCNKTCSQHCLESEDSDGSPCHHNNGTCLFGCQEGYTGSWCEEGGNSTEPVADSIIVLSIILVLVILVWTLCVVYNKRCPDAGPKWWRSLANQIFYSRRATADTGAEERTMLMQEVVVTPTRRQSHTLDQVKKEVFTMVQTLRQMIELHSERGIQCQKYLYEIFWKYFKLREDIGDYLAELGLPEVCVKIGRNYLTARENIQVDHIWSVADYTFRLCRCYGVVSSNFAKSLAALGAVQFLTGILTKRDYLDNLGGERESLLVKSSLVGLRHLALYAENIHYFKESDTIKVLKPLTYSEDESIKSLAETIIDFLKDKKEKVQLTDTPGPSKQTGETNDDPNSFDATSEEKRLEKIRQLFVFNCIPMKIVKLFHFYNGDVLRQEDIVDVTSVTTNKGRFHGACELWHRLVKYKDWYSCLLLVLRDPQVKQDHVADLMENTVELETLDTTNQKLKVENTKLTEEINKLKQENSNLKDEINQARDKIEPLAKEAQTAKQGNSTLTDKINAKNQENAELRREEIDVAKQKSASLTGEINEENKEMTKMAREIKENDDKIAELTEEINEENKKIGILMEKNGDLRDQILKKENNTAELDFGQSGSLVSDSGYISSDTQVPGRVTKAAGYKMS